MVRNDVSRDNTSNSARKSCPSKAKSCSECRRLKLRCICTNGAGSWPCSNCIRRGCQTLCPSQSMEPNSHLQNQRLLRSLHSRIASLESELQEANSKLGAAGATPASFGIDHTPSSSSADFDDQMTSLNAGDSPESKDDSPCTSQEHAAGASYSEGGVLRMNAAGGPLYIGRSGGALYTSGGQLCSSSPGANGRDALDTPSLPVSQAVRNVFLPPFGDTGAQSHDARAHLPTHDTARALMNTYLRDVQWMYCPVDSSTLWNGLDSLYDPGARKIHPHHLSVVLLALALGDIFGNRPSNSNQQQRTDGPAPTPLHQLLFADASAALNGSGKHGHNFLSNPTPHAATALHLMTSYLLSSGDRTAAQAAWSVLGIAFRTAQAMGLHKDSTQWGVEQNVADSHAKLFWEIMVYDRLQALNFGRPYMSCHVECRPPVQMSSDTSTPDTFHAIKYSLCGVFERISDMLSRPHLPPHADVLSMAKELREIEESVPSLLRLDETTAVVELAPEVQAWIVPQRHMLSMLIHKALLFLHRPWFARALLEKGEPLYSANAPSFAAAVASARYHTQILQSVLNACPQALSWWFFLFHAFSAAVIQALVLCRAPGSLLAAEVQRDFELSFSLFSKMSSRSDMARRALPLLQNLRNRILLGLGRSASALPGQSAREDLALLGATAAPGPAVADDSRTAHQEDQPTSRALAISSPSSESSVPASGRPSISRRDDNSDSAFDRQSVGHSSRSNLGSETGEAAAVMLALRGEEHSFTSMPPPRSMPTPQSQPSVSSESTFPQLFTPNGPNQHQVTQWYNAAQPEHSGVAANEPSTGSDLANWTSTDSEMDLSSLLMGSNLPQEYQTPAEWTQLDPLWQCVLFWHPAAGQAQ